MKLEFFKSDAMAEAYPDEPDDSVFELVGGIQATYSFLRDADNDTDLGWITDAGTWLTPDGSHWSDWVVFE